MYFVPAFKGLYAPYWRKDARGVICGLTGFTTKNHIIRATLEAICFQTRDVLEAMKKDCGIDLNKLFVDGIMTSNSLLMQLQADLSGIPVCKCFSIFSENILFSIFLLKIVKSKFTNTEGMGVAMAAGMAEGINLVNNLSTHPQCETFLPTTTDAERDARYSKWKMAVQRSLGWSVSKNSAAMTDERYRLLSSIPLGLFLFGSFLLLSASKAR